MRRGKKRIRIFSAENGFGRLIARAVPAGLACLAVLFSGLHGSAQEPSEAEIKSAFVYNFVKFVEWPPQAGPSRSQRVTVCSFGKDALSSALPEIDGKTAKDKRIRVIQIGTPKDASQCDVLYIARSEKDELARILESLHGAILTIGDSEGFAKQGVMINFFLEKDQVRFEINPEAAQREGLKISSSLLQLARIRRRES